MEHIQQELTNKRLTEYPVILLFDVYVINSSFSFTKSGNHD